MSNDDRRMPGDGGGARKGVAEAIDPTSEEAYWHDNYKGRPYAENATSYDDYGPA